MDALHRQGGFFEPAAIRPRRRRAHAVDTPGGGSGQRENVALRRRMVAGGLWRKRLVDCGLCAGFAISPGQSRFTRHQGVGLKLRERRHA
jgi:hypothetical protein